MGSNMDMTPPLSQRSKLIKQGSAISISESQGSKPMNDIQRKQMLEAKMTHKGSYVKKKRIQIDYELADYQMKNMDVKYDLVSIISRINNAHAYKSETTKWVINELKERKNQLPVKATQIFALHDISDEATLRLLNLKNCVRASNHRYLQT